MRGDDRGTGEVPARPLPAILRPLRHSSYRRLAAGSLVSLFGDGLFLVALPLQVYEISNVPTAMAVVGAVWTASQLLMLAFGGWAVDRFERRRIMIAADLLRGGALGAAGLLSLTGSMALWHFGVVGALVGASNAFFNPAATSIVPDLLPDDELARANAFLGVARPAMVRLLGPAVGGLLVGTAGAGVAFLVDAGTFVVSAALLSRIPRVPSAATEAMARGPVNSLRAVGEGVAFVRANRWCWVWFVASAAGLLAFTGPVDMLLPYVVKNDLGLSQRDAAFFLGAVLAAGGAGSVLMALLVGQRGLPDRAMTAMYLAEALGVALLAAYGAMRTLWQGLVAAVLLNAMFTFSDIAWTTTLQRRVPRRLLGRVSSLDWMAALAAMPVSFVVAGRVAEVAGAREVLLGASAVGAVVVLALMVVPGARAPEEGAVPAVAALRDESR